MAQLLRHHNWNYNSAIPLVAGDRYYGQDLIRDFWHHKDNIGNVVKDTIGVPVIISGGVVTWIDVTHINVTKCKAYVNFDVEIIDQFTGFPPTKKTQSIVVRVESGFDGSHNSVVSENLDITTLPGYLGASVQTYYLTLRYLEVDGFTRVRAFSAGTYSYEKVPSYVWELTTTLPTGGTKVVVSEITTDSSGQVVGQPDIDQETVNITVEQDINGSLPPVGSIVGVHHNVLTAYSPSEDVWAYCGAVGSAPAGWGGLVAGNALPVNRFSAGNVPDLSDDRFIMGSTTGATSGGSNSHTPSGTMGAPSWDGTGTIPSVSHTVAFAHSHLWNDGSVAGNRAIGLGPDGGTGSGSYLSTGALDAYSNDPDDPLLGRNYYTSSSLPTVNFSHTHAFTGGSADSKPQYFTCRFFIRIR